MNKKSFKMRNVVAIAICLAGMVMVACCENNLNKDLNNPLVNTRTATQTAGDVNEIGGNFAGTYTWTNLTRDWSLSSTPSLELKAGKYAYKGLSNTGFYDSGSGNYSIKENKIIFELTDCPAPMQAIGVIDSWLLDGEYEYKVDGDKLIFSKTATLLEDEYRYEFVLKKDTLKP